MAKHYFRASVVFSTFALVGASANAASITNTTDASVLASTLLSGVSGVSIVAGSETLIGVEGQQGTFTGFNLVPNNPGLPTLTLGDGIVLTTGGTDGAFGENTSTNFEAQDPGTGSNAALEQILDDAGAPSNDTNDQNELSFDFVADPGVTSISANFIFASDEFPDQDVTDVFGFFVDGVNYASFADGSLVSFVEGENEVNFLDNDFGTGNYDFEYDGLSRVLQVTGLLDPLVDVHTLAIAIADTSDDIFDSVAFLSSLAGGTSVPGNGGGSGVIIAPPIMDDDVVAPIPLPAAGWMMLAGVGALFGLGRRRAA